MFFNNKKTTLVFLLTNFKSLFMKIFYLVICFVVLGAFSNKAMAQTLTLNGSSGGPGGMEVSVGESYLGHSGEIKVSFPVVINGGNRTIRIDWQVPGGGVWSQSYSTYNNLDIYVYVMYDDFTISTSWSNYNDGYQNGIYVPWSSTQTMLYHYSRY